MFFEPDKVYVVVSGSILMKTHDPEMAKTLNVSQKSIYEDGIS